MVQILNKVITDESNKNQALHTDTKKLMLSIQHEIASLNVLIMKCMAKTDEDGLPLKRKQNGAGSPVT